MSCSSQSNNDLGFIQFNLKINTLRYQHAVAVSGQKLLHLILRTLIHGDINNISSCVRKTLNTTALYEIKFTKDELQCLEKGDHYKWDITLIFKVIQNVCGLAAAGDNCWTQPTGDVEPLEYHITTLKNLRNELVHNFGLVIDEDKLTDHLDELKNLALNITSSLGKCAQKQGKQLSINESDETIKLVLEIIEDVKEKINESTPALTSSTGAVPGSVDVETSSVEEDVYESDSYQPDSMFVVAGAGGRVPQETSMEEVLLKKEFWEYAGPKDAVV